MIECPYCTAEAPDLQGEPCVARLFFIRQFPVHIHCIADIVLLRSMVSGRGKRNKDVLFSVHGGKTGQTQPCGGGIPCFAALDLCPLGKLCSVQLAQQCTGQRNAFRVLRSRCGGVVLAVKMVRKVALCNAACKSFAISAALE